MTVPKAPEELDARGQRLWRDIHSQGPLTPDRRALLEEACRIADRLDLLDSIIRAAAAGVNAEESSGGDLQRWLAESRQQSATLKGLLAEIRSNASTSKASAPQPAAKGAGSGVTDLGARIAERRKKASG